MYDDVNEHAVCACIYMYMTISKHAYAYVLVFPATSDLGLIHNASDFDPTIANLIQAMNDIIGFPLATSQ